MLRRFFLAVILPISCLAGSENWNYPINKMYSRTTLRHIEGGGIGYKNGYTTLEAFLASDPNLYNTTVFLDFRSHVFNSGRWAANAGIGIRSVWQNRVYGVNAYYDYRNGERFDSNQLGAGFESLGELFDFRINGYLPFGKMTSNSYDTGFGGFSGNNLFLLQKYQSAMKGADAEIGFHFGGFRAFDFYAAVGPYYFKGKSTSSAWGGKARISGTYNDMLSVEFSNSYDKTFHNNFQAQVSLRFNFGGESYYNEQTCMCNFFNDLMLQSVNRQEIIVMDTSKKRKAAIDPATGQPYFFVFVDNTSSSSGTYESPYHTLAQAQENSSPNNIIYVFPGDGTTTGMDSGITLKSNQKFWGSGVSHLLQTTQGTILIPALTSSSPTITNTNFDTEGNAITLAVNNAISGFTITSALNDAIYGTNPQNLDVSSCTFENTNTFAVEASFLDNASVTITNNQFLNNVNGLLFTFNGASTLICANNTFRDQTSVSSTPLEIVSNSNTLFANIESNIFKNNTTGSIRLNFNDVLDAKINVINNTISNNGTGFQSSLGSSLVVISNGTNDSCTIELKSNKFTDNASNCLYMHTSGTFESLDITASANTMSNNAGSGLVLATPVNTLTLLATDNSITECSDNGIAVIASGLTTTGNITISNNSITDIGNASNGIAINQDFTALNLNIMNNEINRCEGTGIISYAPAGIDSLTLNISGNTISHCLNQSSNSSAGIDIEQYKNLAGTISNNTLLDNTGLGVFFGSTLTSPNACISLTGNNSNTGYLFVNPVDGTFNLTPCNVDTVNEGTINTLGVINNVQSCSDTSLCPP